MITGLDTYSNMHDYAGAITAAGYSFVGRYLSNGVGTIHNPFLKVEASHLSSSGLKLISILEFGHPDHDSYFTLDQANQNVKLCVEFAKLAGQPIGTEIFGTIDYDATVKAVYKYVMALHNGLRDAGYLHSLYGNGVVCQWAKQSGYAHHTWLAEGSGMAGYKTWLPKADIVQQRTVKFHDFDVDTDIAKSSEFGAWTL